MWNDPAVKMPKEKEVVIGKVKFDNPKYGVLPMPVYMRCHDHTGRPYEPCWTLKAPASLFESVKGFDVIGWMDFNA